ncbi:MAG: hypothetical protein CMM50_17490 [Rhodospirillaceae bacterium]|nr:hypothetical protein [Rhodospirillaceae bacterium]|tara:strand:- start:60 stop:365 length:306 start_codon:yes stop_codon:yes gene_type:complete
MTTSTVAKMITPFAFALMLASGSALAQADCDRGGAPKAGDEAAHAATASEGCDIPSEEAKRGGCPTGEDEAQYAATGSQKGPGCPSTELGGAEDMRPTAKD